MNIRSAIAAMRRLAVIRQGSFVADAKRLKNGSITLTTRLRQFCEMKLKDSRRRGNKAKAPVENYTALPPMPLDNQCPTLKEEIKPPVFILLGQYSELIAMLPAFLAIHKQTGLKPVVIVSHEYMDVFEGVSYVTPHRLRADYYAGMPAARIVAETLCGGVTLQPWNKGRAVEQDRSGAIILQSFGLHWGVPNMGTSNQTVCMWQRAGFTVEEMMSLPLVFDQRNPEREAVLIRQAQQYNPQKKPLLLYNFRSLGSPFGYTPEVQRVFQPVKKDYHLVDLGMVKAERIYDLIGLYEAAAGLVTIDTATLALAAATKIPYLAFTEDGWLGSVTNGNCVFHCQYSMAKENLPMFKQTLSELSVKP